MRGTEQAPCYGSEHIGDIFFRTFHGFRSVFLLELSVINLLQASGDVDIDIVQGVLGGSIKYQDGCNNAECTWPRADSTRVKVGGGCSSIKIKFTDAGSLNKWLHVSGRRMSEQCAGDPDYPSCNKVGGRRLTAQERFTSVQGFDLASVSLDSLDDAAQGTGRSLLVDDDRSVAGAEIERQAGHSTGEPNCVPNQDDVEHEAREDIDRGLDSSCSVFKVSTVAT
jgi:hypothetical protein